MFGNRKTLRLAISICTWYKCEPMYTKCPVDVLVIEESVMHSGPEYSEIGFPSFTCSDLSVKYFLKTSMDVSRFTGM